MIAASAALCATRGNEKMGRHRILFISCFVCLSATPAFAEYATPPPTCMIGGVTYPWSSPQCAEARAAWASVKPTIPPTTKPTATPTPTRAPTPTSGPTATPAPTATPKPVATATPGGNRIILPGGTPIKLVVTDKISSSNANVGDTFGIKAADDIVVDGWVVVAKGAGGLAEIVKVDRAGSHGHPGSLAIQLDFVYGVDGNKIKLTAQQKPQEGENKAGASSTATILSYVFLGPLGLFMHNFVKGHDVELTPENTAEHPLTAFVDNSVYITAQTRADSGAGFAPPVPTSAPVPNNSPPPTPAR